MEKIFNSKNSPNRKDFENEIDLREIILLVLRNKLLIVAFASISFILAFLYSLSLKKVWEGQFQIVLDSEEPSKINSLSPNLTNIKGTQKNNNLSTQVGVLESPSILMPIYEFANKEKIKNLNKKQTFKNWKSNLDIKLKEGTSILNIVYRDTNKEIILPTLKKMSSIYQDYSGSQKQRGENLTEKYLINQINLFREKSAESLKKVQNYAIEQDMNYFPNNSLNSTEASLKEESDIPPQILKSIVSIENIRVSAANDIRNINLQIKKINELDPKDYESLQYFGSSIPALNIEGLPQKLKKIEGKLVDLRTQFTENDPSIIRLLEQRKLTIELLKSRAIKYLKIAKLESEAEMEAAMRPKGVLLKYRELKREAARDEKTLLTLENDLRLLKLEQAKLQDPWQLITKPTLLKNPVAPSRLKIGLFGLIAGGFLGLLGSIYKEKKSDKFFTINQIENLLSLTLIEKINKNDNFINSKQVNFLKEFLLNQKATNIAFITLDQINKSYLESLIDYFMLDANLNKKINLISSQENLSDFKNTEFSILFASLNSSSYSEIKSLKTRLNLLNIYFKGLVLLDK
ncbi:MAG: Wzz/FepE/Etk N-terminal domain-containing protein [Prochlorococcus marinus XMU1429]|nr:Wzz/FepE/Etk N-terminal domain-containing protein [Prochlorococcus marinus XMU1429]